MRDKFFKIRVTKDEVSAWEAHVLKHSLGSISEWFRQLAAADISGTTTDVAQVAERRVHTPEAPGATPGVGISPSVLPATSAPNEASPTREAGVAEGVPPFQQGAVVSVGRPTPCPRFFLHVPGISCSACGQ